MPKKNMTEAEKKAWGQKMKLAREKAKKKPQPEPVAQPQVAIDPNVLELLERIKELESAGFRNKPQVTDKGVLGTVEKYRVDPELYPDPTKRLADEKRLQQFAFKFNYELEWKVSVSSYQTLDGINTKEPKFHLQINRIVYDDDGELTNGRYIVRKLVMHEDPQTAIIVAREKGLPVDEENELSFLNEMRYLRMRDWLFDLFYPQQVKPETKKTEKVVGGQLVEFFEVNSEETESIPFGTLKSKLK